MQKIEITDFITALRESFAGSEYVFTNGSCYQLYKMLAAMYPGAEAFYRKGHVVTRLDGRFYDITGELEDAGFEPYREDFNCHNNRFSLWGNAWECPNCDEITEYATLCFGRSGSDKDR